MQYDTYPYLNMRRKQISHSKIEFRFASEKVRFLRFNKPQYHNRHIYYIIMCESQYSSSEKNKEKKQKRKRVNRH